MRKVHDTQRRPGAPDIRRIRPTAKSRVDVPAILIGLQDPAATKGPESDCPGFRVGWCRPERAAGSAGRGWNRGPSWRSAW